MKNFMKTKFSAVGENESFARVAVASFVAALDPTVEELSDIKTALSEAVTNAIIHGYESRGGIVTVECSYDEERTVELTVTDSGKGIENPELALTPLYTSSPVSERAGMGFTVMQTFMDNLILNTTPGEGTSVHMTKVLSTKKENAAQLFERIAADNEYLRQK